MFLFYKICIDIDNVHMFKIEILRKTKAELWDQTWSVQKFGLSFLGYKTRRGITLMDSIIW